ncbi:MAG: hypothetical protein CME70_15375 [Halobacteriovorax sp.]|nr:hypothetical protein [Halobacteriovorax sp.]|tara:strand:- start:55486 stop:56313 length:828 start_codon:yes stop_codon:yes gene_type:complete
MKKIAFLTKDELEDFSCDDDLAIPVAHKYGLEISTISWHSETDWSFFDAVIIRSTWDYQDHYEEFIKVLDKISSETLLLNNIDTVKWNSHKSYLKELQESGHKIIPTLFHDQIIDKSVDELCDLLGTEKIIYKPYIGANSDNTFPRLRGESVPQVKLENFFVQIFLDSVLTEGEFSLFFFNGEYSHAILKTPKPGDYRVQEEWGGEIKSITPEEKLIETAKAIVDPTQLYNRVDLVRNNDSFELMELELIEPALYFRTSKGAEENFLKALVTRLR